jgi:hypothetical protein
MNTEVTLRLVQFLIDSFFHNQRLNSLHRLLLPEPDQAHHRAEFEGFRLLELRNLNGFPRTLFRFFCFAPEAFSLKPIASLR